MIQDDYFFKYIYFKHTFYDDEQFFFNALLFIMDAKLEFDDSIQPACLPFSQSFDYPQLNTLASTVDVKRIY